METLGYSVAFLGLVSVITLCQAAVAVDNGANSGVNVTFYQLPESQWAEAEPLFKGSLVQQSDGYCVHVLGECAGGGELEFSKALCTSCKINATLSVDDIKVVKMTNIKNNQQIFLVVAEQGKYTSLFMKDMLVERPFRYAVADSVGHAIIAVDDATFSPMPTHLNAIIVPICVLITISIFLVAVVCHFRNKRRLQREEEMVQARKLQPLEKAQTDGDSREADPMV